MKIFIAYVVSFLFLALALIFVLRTDLDYASKKVKPLKEISVFYWIWAGQTEIESNVQSLFKLCMESFVCNYEHTHLHLISYDDQQLFTNHLSRDTLRNLNLWDNGIVITFRLESLPSPYDIGDIYYKSKLMLENEGYQVSGLEIDYDSPSSKIEAYTTWIKKLSSLLENGTLEITGLPTWVNESYLESKELLNVVNRINFQLYQKSTNIIPSDNFLSFIKENQRANLALFCVDHAIIKELNTITTFKKKISIGFFLANTCAPNIGN